MTDKDVIKSMELQSALNISKMFKDIIEDNDEEMQRRSTLWQEYKGDVPIKNREKAVEQKSNKKIAVPKRNYIIKQALGYFLGNQIVYNIKDSEYSDAENKKNKAVLDNFIDRNKIEKKDLQLGEYVSVCGVGYRLCFIDTNGDERVMNLRPWEAIVFYDATIEEPQYAMIYYDVETVEGLNKTTRKKIEWYDKTNVTFYMEDANGNFFLDSDYETNPMPHMFTGHIPVIQYDNNTIQTGDYELVRELIDEYDETISDVANEFRDSALATLIIKNANITKEVLDNIKKTGAAGFTDPVNGQPVDVFYLQKEINTEFVENHKKTLSEDILIFSDSVNMSDENFSGGTQTGESRKWKLVALENKTKVKEVEFRNSTRMMFDVVTSALNAKGANLKASDITLTFTRNLPVDTAQAADTNAKLVGTISDKSRLALLPFITDVEEELQRMAEEKANNNAIDLDKIITNDTTASE